MKTKTINKSAFFGKRRGMAFAVTRRMLLFMLLAIGLFPGAALANPIEESQFENMTVDEICEAVGKPDDQALNFKWEPGEEENSVSVLSLGEGTASDIVDIAEGEPDGVPLGGDANKYNSFNGDPWCAYFVVWCAREAGVTPDVIPSYYGCSYLAGYYKNKGLWHSYAYTPKAGDLIFYSTSSKGSACHVGLVTKISGGYIWTKEGNTTGGKVTTHKRQIGSNGYPSASWYIVGYASPDYAKHAHSFPASSYDPCSDLCHIVKYEDCACGEGCSSKSQNCTYVWFDLSYECKYCGAEYVVHGDGEYVAIDSEVSIYSTEDVDGSAVGTIPKGKVIKLANASINSKGRYVSHIEYNGVAGYVQFRDLMFNGSAGVHDYIGGKCSTCGLREVYSAPGIYVSDKSVTLYKANVLSSFQSTLPAGDAVCVTQVGVTTYGWYWGYTSDGYYLDMGDLTDKLSELPTNGAVAEVEDAIYCIHTAGDNNLVIDALSFSVGEQKQCQIKEKDETVSQLFKIIKNEDGTYRIQNVNSAYVLSVEPSEDVEGGAVLQSPWAGDDSQSWYLETSDDGYFSIRSKLNNLYVSVDDQGFLDGARLVQSISSGTGEQKFLFEQVDGASIERIWGYEANETSAAISSNTFATSEWVVIARDDDFADAMSATGLAGTLNCPIVLTDRRELSVAAANEIERLNATKAYIIGGRGAIPANLELELEALGIVYVERVWGDNSWDTSVECAKKIIEHGGNAETSIVAMSLNFQDALSISSFAYKYEVPIYLQMDKGSRPLPDEAVEMIETAGGSIYVPGGPLAVKESTVEDVFGEDRVIRIYGEDGYDTSNQVATYMVEKGLLNADIVTIACGASKAGGVDALSGAALAGSTGGVILLTNSNVKMEEAHLETVEGEDSQGSPAFLFAHAGDISQCYALGGPYVMQEELMDDVLKMLSL